MIFRAAGGTVVVGSAFSLGVFWRADVLVRLCALENGGRGRPPSNKFSSSPRTSDCAFAETVRDADPTTESPDTIASLAPSPGTPGEGWGEGFSNDADSEDDGPVKKSSPCPLAAYREKVAPGASLGGVTSFDDFSAPFANHDVITSSNRSRSAGDSNNPPLNKTRSGRAGS